MGATDLLPEVVALLRVVQIAQLYSAAARQIHASVHTVPFWNALPSVLHLITHTHPSRPPQSHLLQVVLPEQAGLGSRWAGPRAGIQGTILIPVPTLNPWCDPV